MDPARDRLEASDTWQPNRLTRRQVLPVGLGFRKLIEHAQRAPCESRHVLPLRRNLGRVAMSIGRVQRARMLPLVRFQKKLASRKRAGTDRGMCAIHEMESSRAMADSESVAFDIYQAME